MIKFLTPEIREVFHQLPLDKQREFNDLAETLLVRGHSLFVEWVALEELEVIFRIDEKL